MKNLNDVTTQLKLIPQRKFWAKVRSTLTGLAFIGAAAAVFWYTDAPWWVSVGLFGIGMNVVSGDLVRLAFKAALASAKDVLSLVRKEK